MNLALDTHSKTTRQHEGLQQVHSSSVPTSETNSEESNLALNLALNFLPKVYELFFFLLN